MIRSAANRNPIARKAPHEAIPHLFERHGAFNCRCRSFFDTLDLARDTCRQISEGRIPRKLKLGMSRILTELR